MSEQEEKVYRIRKLTRKDRKTLASLIGKLAEKANDTQLLNIIQSEYSEKADKDPEQAKKEANAVYAELAIKTFDCLLELLESDVAVWFADLLGLSIEEFDECPFGIEAMIVEQIVNSKEIADFFGSASGAYKTIQKFGIVTNVGKTK